MNFLKTIFIVVGACLLIAGGFLLFWQWSNPNDKSASLAGDFNQSRPSLRINNFEIYLDLAATNEEKRRGLSGRNGLEENEGMLFVFEEPGFYSFWMKDMLFPIDIIWISRNKEVVFVKKDAQPCQNDICPSIKPDKKAKYVLEIKAGKVDQFDIKAGDKVDF